MKFDESSWKGGNTGAEISGDAGNTLGFENVSNTPVAKSIVSSEGERPANFTDLSNVQYAERIQPKNWYLDEPHTTVLYYEDFAYVKGDYYRRLYFKGKPVFELPVSWALWYEDSTQYEFAFITDNEFVLYYPVGGGADTYCLQIWSLLRDSNTKDIVDIKPTLTHYFVGIEQYAVIPSTIVISDHYLCFATQIYWREAFRMHRNNEIQIVNASDQVMVNNVMVALSPWDSFLDKSDTLVDTEGTGITKSGVPVMGKQGDMYNVLGMQGIGAAAVSIPLSYTVENAPSSVQYSMECSISKLDLFKNIEGAFLPNMHKFVCFYRSCFDDNFHLTNPSGEPEFVPLLCRMSNGSIRLNLSITRDFATVWDEDVSVSDEISITGDDYSSGSGSGSGFSSSYVDRYVPCCPLMVYCGEWNKYPKARYVGGFSYSDMAREFVFGDGYVKVHNSKGEIELWRKQLSLIYRSSPIPQSTYYFTYYDEIPHLRIMYWKGTGERYESDDNEYSWSNYGENYWSDYVSEYSSQQVIDLDSTNVKSHKIVGDVPWYWRLGCSYVGGYCPDSCGRYGWTYRFPNLLDGSQSTNWVFNVPDGISDAGGRTIYSIIDETEWRLWFNYFTKILSEGLIKDDGDDVNVIYGGAPPFGAYKFELEVFWTRTEEVKSLPLVKSEVRRLVFSETNNTASLVLYEANVFELSGLWWLSPNNTLLRVFEAWVLYSWEKATAGLYIRHGRWWQQIPLPYTVLPKIEKSCTSGNCPTRCGEVDRVLYFIDTVSDVEHITAGVYIRYPNGRNEWIFGEMIVSVSDSGSGTGSGY